ncbi:efflux RND transporter periplasmic adaptor subunit [Alteromonas stellipolaris]|uniref:Efflux transporter periplasmic adaptor subunit n=1 Tax=Alteromonas stellipolaris TaxID=233316 RepID=A0ABM5YMP8_9ALTE|nr:efflux RND transporter periplasmic adaptor subunit [Alteromonas stellipolaris]ALM89467.1 Cobalt/zinc/cadmium efflux RND transporter, membrane fusion protein, CzcB [Alteromonas stellipolaris LMG 21856]AMJ75410.1 efflux transporter periplasmic adaptor subunit [Alteromonas stellipolaris]
MKTLFILIVGLLGGAAAVFVWNTHIHGNSGVEALATNGDNKSNNKTPLYWVAPMDDAYRRDKPGKSPMGMDLVPVFAASGSSEKRDDGEVRISPQVQQNMGVKFTTVKRGKLDLTFNAVGNVTYNEDYLVHIHPRVEGWIDKLFIKTEGEAVSQGQKLYTLYSPALVTAQEEFVIALKRGDTRLTAGAKQRLKALHLSAGFIAQLEKTREVSQTITFFAPQDGVVEHLGVREGFYVQPGTTVLSIARLDSVWVEARVFEQDVPKVTLGQQASITFDYLPSKTFTGKVDFIYPALDVETRTLKVRVTLKNDSGDIKPNMFANVIFTKQTEQPVLYAPYQSVIQIQSQGQNQDLAPAQTQNRIVMNVEESFKSIGVSVGRKAGEFIEITQGLNEGDKVVVSAQFLIDSESSKASDFKRMQSPLDQETHNREMNRPEMHQETKHHQGMPHDGMSHDGMSHESSQPSAEHQKTKNNAAKHHEGMHHD